MKRSVSTWYERQPMKTLYVAHVQCRNISEHQKYQTTESLRSSVTLAHRPPYSLLSPSTSAIQFYYWRSATESFFVLLSGFSVWFPRILRKFWFFFLFIKRNLEALYFIVFFLVFGSSESLQVNVVKLAFEPKQGKM